MNLSDFGGVTRLPVKKPNSGVTFVHPTPNNKIKLNIAALTKLILAYT